MNRFTSILLFKQELKKEEGLSKYRKLAFLLFVIQIKGWYGVTRIEETKLAGPISRKWILVWKTANYHKMDPTLSKNDFKIIAKWSQMPSTHPHPWRQQKSPARRQQS